MCIHWCWATYCHPIKRWNRDGTLSITRPFRPSGFAHKTFIFQSKSPFSISSFNLCPLSVNLLFIHISVDFFLQSVRYRVCNSYRIFRIKINATKNGKKICQLVWTWWKISFEIRRKSKRPPRSIIVRKFGNDTTCIHFIFFFINGVDSFSCDIFTLFFLFHWISSPHSYFLRWKLTVASIVEYNIYNISIDFFTFGHWIISITQLIRFQLLAPSMKTRKRPLKEISTYCFNCHRKLPMKYYSLRYRKLYSSISLWWPILLGASMRIVSVVKLKML